MVDFITAIMGGKHCGWCTDKPSTLFERLFRLDQIVSRSERPWYERMAVWWYIQTVTNAWPPLWKLGQKWHYKFHV